MDCISYIVKRWGNRIFGKRKDVNSYSELLD